MNIAIIFAGGKGERLGGSGESLPKQFLEIDKKPILVHTLLKFQNHKDIDKIYISVLPKYLDYTKELVRKFDLTKVEEVTQGGQTAQESIYNALMCAQKSNPDESIVLIHDGVRPVITDKVISENIKSVLKYGSAITSTPCYETILISPDGINPKIVPYRNETYKAQAPQSFYLGEIIEAHNCIRKTKEGYKNIVDSCTLFHVLNKKAYLVEGNFGNIKITTPQDVCILKGILDFLNGNDDE